ncbi:MAG TPA: c-type cytochrome [Rhodocyclaceae bacterium]|nr:c-type cytochrome [Rhodocyclaceae bacterium]
MPVRGRAGEARRVRPPIRDRRARVPGGLRLLACLVFAGLAGVAGGVDDHAYGKEINLTCAGCHGAYGQGGKRGEYPRLAGQRALYMEEQMIAFREKRRYNPTMYPYAVERDLPDEDMKAVIAYLASIELPTRPPEPKPGEDALTRMKALELVMVVPRVEGDVANGERVYQSECANCHGKTGRGRSNFPMLVGQYTHYLRKQIEAYLRHDRPHDDDRPGGVLETLKERDVQDILAYLTTLQ